MHETVTIIAEYVIAIPAISYLVLAFYERREWKKLLLFTFVSAVIAILLIKIATTLHSDPRPFMRDGVTPYFRSATDNGFPSDHTASSSFVAAIVFTYNKRAGVALAVVALLIGTARVIGGVHHAQDIIGGFIIALISVYLANLVMKLLLPKLKNGTANEV